IYELRRTNPQARPPRTVVQQNTVVQNFDIKNINVRNMANVPAAAPLTRLQRTSTFNLQTVPKQRLQEIQKTAGQVHAFSQERAKVELQASRRAQPRLPPGQTAAPHRIELPKNRPALPRIPDGVKIQSPPPRPQMPEPRHIQHQGGQPFEPTRGNV